VLICVFLAVNGITLIVRACEDDYFSGVQCGSVTIRGYPGNFCACGTSLCNRATAAFPGTKAGSTGGSFMLSASVITTLTAVAFVQWHSAGFM
jgi:hypothetical protein